MIELTDEQNALFEKASLFAHEPVMYKGNLQTLFNSLTKDQIKQLAEQHNADVIKWIGFDADDESTWPKVKEVIEEDDGYVFYQTKTVLNQDLEKVFLIFYVKDGKTTISEWDVDREGCNGFNMEVTQWAYLPTSKDKL